MKPAAAQFGSCVAALIDEFECVFKVPSPSGEKVGMRGVATKTRTTLTQPESYKVRVPRVACPPVLFKNDPLLDKPAVAPNLNNKS